MSWAAAFGWAFLVEGAIAAFLLAGFYGALSGFAGADNPALFIVAFTLQFPASLLAEPVDVLATKLSLTNMQGLYVSAAAVALLELVFFAVLFRKPWRAGDRRVY